MSPPPPCAPLRRPLRTAALLKLSPSDSFPSPPSSLPPPSLRQSWSGFLLSGRTHPADDSGPRGCPWRGRPRRGAALPLASGTPLRHGLGGCLTPIGVKRWVSRGRSVRANVARTLTHTVSTPRKIKFFTRLKQRTCTRRRHRPLMVEAALRWVRQLRRRLGSRAIARVGRRQLQRRARRRRHGVVRRGYGDV